MMKIKLPIRVEYIIDKLERSGFKAYAVGGCIRDYLMRKTPKDWDIATSALPYQVMEIFKNHTVVPTGIQHGTVTVVLQNDGEPDGAFEITTFRKDGQYDDSRHPNDVEFVDDIREDLSRRDFTINAMAYNYINGLIDPFGGQDDIEHGIIRCVGNPADRFSEDALRRLRALRFALILNYSIEDKTYDALLDNLCDSIKAISVERIRAEFVRILMECDIEVSYFDINERALEQSDKKKYLAQFLTVIESITLEDSQSLDKDKIYAYLANAHHDISLRLALIFRGYDIKNILRKLKFSNQIINNTVLIDDVSEWAIGELKTWNEPQYFDLLQTYYDEYLASKRRFRPVFISDIKSIPYISFVRYFCRVIARRTYNSFDPDYIFNYLESVYYDDDSKIPAFIFISRDVYYCIKDDFPTSGFFDYKYLTVDGNDLMTIGYQGKEIGEALDDVIDQIMCENLINTHENLMWYLRMRYRSVVNHNG